MAQIGVTEKARIRLKVAKGCAFLMQLDSDEEVKDWDELSKGDRADALAIADGLIAIVTGITAAIRLEFKKP
jgi:hypothetical protein